MNTLYYGDNLPILREHITTESVDLVYLVSDGEGLPHTSQISSTRSV
jgi:hypothetical protein